MSGELLPALLASPQALWTHQGHTLHPDAEGVVYELSDGPEGGIGNQVGGQGLLVVEEVLAGLDVTVKHNMTTLLHHVDHAHITSARLPHGALAPA